MRVSQLVLCCLLALLVGLESSQTSLAEEATASRQERMEWWREAKFGMFIHWGVYAAPAGVYKERQVPGLGEWIQRDAKISVSDYREFANRFNPTKYNPQAWAALARQAGMRYVVITAKHHDGFSLYDSEVSEWDIAGASPYKKDLLSPLAQAVRGKGLKFGLYYSQAQDWTHPGGAKMGLKEGDGWDPAHKGDYDKYLRRIALPQTREILSRYKPDVLWWDTPVWMTPERAAPFHKLLAGYPNLITNNRLGGGYHGDTETPEQRIPATGIDGRDWETCMTMNNTWGFKSHDANWKSTETLLRNLVDIVSKGGNYLLNVGPTAEGEIPQESIDRLQQIGRWMDANGRSIYGTTASPCRAPKWGRLTQRPGSLYLHVFDWPADGKLVIPVKVETTTLCRLLADPQRKFAISASEEGLVVQLQGDPVDRICTVIEVGITGEPTEVIRRIVPSANGQLVLNADDAVLRGSARVETISGKDNIGYWTDARSTASWQCRIEQPGRYRVTASLAAPSASRAALIVGEVAKQVGAAPTGSYQSFKSQPLGEIDINVQGDTTITVKPEAKRWHPINVRSITLTPLG